MLRAAALLLVLFSVALMLPFVDSSAHNDRPTVVRHSHMGQRHSRAWWRRHRARLRRLHAEMKRKQALQASRGQSLNVESESHKTTAASDKFPVARDEFKSPVNALSLPNGWSRRGVVNGEMKFVVSASNGQSVGAATITLVNGQASGETVMNARGNRRMLGGVPLTELRRTVIDKMIASNGWVVNDITREIEGQPVFIVLAATGASSDGRTPPQSLAFYFTEVEGRIYSLATSALPEFSDRVANESAQLMSSFLVNNRKTTMETSQR